MTPEDLEESDVRSVRALHVQGRGRAEAYDQLVAEAIEGIKANEPGTLVYASHCGGPAVAAVFYELYRDRTVFEAHEASPHTRRYLEERGQYLASTEVDWLTLQAGKGTGG